MKHYQRNSFPRSCCSLWHQISHWVRTTDPRTPYIMLVLAEFSWFPCNVTLFKADTYQACAKSWSLAIILLWSSTKKLVPSSGRAWFVLCALYSVMLFLTRKCIFPFCSYILAKEVCYGKYGCFSRQPPFNNWWVSLPLRPTFVGTTFNLYTRSNRKDPNIIDDNDQGKLTRSQFDITKRTILIIHGYTGKWTQLA